jgi:hypothetical protein
MSDIHDFALFESATDAGGGWQMQYRCDLFGLTGYSFAAGVTT